MDSGFGYAVGELGLIMKYYDDSVTFNSPVSGLLNPDNFYLYQNFPNPFNPTTKISWQSPVSSWQTLKIFDLLGNEVKTLVNEYRPAGEYETEFDGTRLPSGVYFYQLRAGSYLETKKMVLLK